MLISSLGNSGYDAKFTTHVFAPAEHIFHWKMQLIFYEKLLSVKNFVGIPWWCKKQRNFQLYWFEKSNKKWWLGCVNFQVASVLYISCLILSTGMLELLWLLTSLLSFVTINRSCHIKVSFNSRETKTFLFCFSQLWFNVRIYQSIEKMCLSNNKFKRAVY